MKHLRSCSAILALLFLAIPCISVSALDTIEPLTAVYGDTLADLALPDGYLWQVKSPEAVEVGDVGLHYFAASNATESVDIPVNVSPAFISSVSVKTDGSQYYTGKPVEPKIEASFKGKTLTQGTDYTVSYADNTNVGTAQVIIQGIGNFKGKTTVSFSVLKVDVTDVTLDCHEAEMAPGQTLKLAEIVSPANATFKNVTWTSSDDDIASVDENGVVTAKSNGTAIIQVETNDGGYTDYCTINVFTHVESMMITTGTVVMRVKDTYKLKTIVLPLTSSDQEIVWSSANEEVVTVDENGILTSVGRGVATITAKTVDGELIDTCEVKVIYTWWQCIIWLFLGCIWYF